jgi:hypothetical protein
MTEEQADILADVFNILVGVGKPSAFVHEYRDGTFGIILRSKPGLPMARLSDVGEFARALKEHIDRD